MYANFVSRGQVGALNGPLTTPNTKNNEWWRLTQHQRSQSKDISSVYLYDAHAHPKTPHQGHIFKKYARQWQYIFYIFMCSQRQWCVGLIIRERPLPIQDEKIMPVIE